MVDGTVLVTGGTGGLGVAVTEELAAAGWRVVATALPRQAEIAPAETRDGVEVVGADLTDPNLVDVVIGVATGRPRSPLRAVVNLVGGYAGGPRVHETPVEDFERQLTLNLRPAFLVSRAALPHLVEAGGGSVVYVSSRAAVQPFAGAAGYITAKAAVLAFAQVVAVEYRTQGVRANTVLPSVIDTPANRTAQPQADHSKWVPPAEIARVIRFLCGEESAPTSGAAIPVYGRA
ncbi:MAG TPA: SDR family NAD(P)-dependent oxidoreductase [Actinomycetota bacterium]